MNLTNRVHFFLLLTGTGAPTAFIACGGHSTTNTAECAAGTSPENGVCAVPDSGSTDAAASADVAATQTTDSAMIFDSGSGIIDATSTNDALGQDAGEGDSALGTDAESGTAPSSCPVESPGVAVVVDCDEACADAGAMAPCATATCENGPIILMPLQAGFTQILRTPAAAGNDPACATDCPDGGYAYGLGIQFWGTTGDGPMGNVHMTVAPPWFIIYGGTRYCDYRDSGPGYTASCVNDTFIGGEVFYIMTKDPNAPATNVTIKYTGNSFQNCPADGGI